jgi:DNA-directed RNA polymerase beta' subunit
MHDAKGLRRDDREFSQSARKRPSRANTATTGDGDSEMEVDEVVNTDSEGEEEGGPGDASATHGEEPVEDPEPARAANGKVKGTRGRNEQLLPPEEVRTHLRHLFRNEATICSLIYGRQGPYALIDGGPPLASADVFFIECMVVSPTRFRPPLKMGEQLFEHPKNDLLTKVLNTTYRIRDTNESLRLAKDKDKDRGNLSTPADATRLLEQLFGLMVTLQNDVNSFIDESKSTTAARQGKLPTPGVKQGLEKKKGLFRMNMMVSNPTVILDTRLIVATGQTGELCCALRHLTRCQYRNQ